MEFFQTIILGIVEGLTEFLPISSTGHLILVGRWFQMPSTEFWKSFNIAIQLGAILAVVIMYWKRFLNIRDVFLKVVVAFLPTAFLGLIFYKIVKTFLLGNYLVVLLALLIGGILILLFEKYYQEEKAKIDSVEKISWKQAVVIGLCQSLSMIPGVSRSAATILGGLSLKIKRQTIVEFSFLLAAPTMLAATGLDLLKTGFSFSYGEWLILLLGMFSAFVSALVVIKWFLRFVQTHDFKIFGWYRIILSLILLLFFVF